MDKKQLEDIFKPSVMERMNEIQRQIDPLHQIRNSSKILEMMEQNAHISSASNIGEIARKALQQAALDSNKFENQSTIARYADLGFRDTLALQNTFFNARKELSAYSDALPVKERIIRGMIGASEYQDIKASLNQFKKSVETFRGSLHQAGKALNESEISRLVKELQSSKVIPESTLSEYAGAFKQLESLRNLESFKAISRLKNFPSNKIWTQYYSELPEITESFLIKAKQIDAKISGEVSSVNDFNDLSEDNRHALEKFSLSYYHIFIIYYIYYIVILKNHIHNNLKYSNMKFDFVGVSSTVLLGVCFIGYQPDFNSICDSIVAAILLMAITRVSEK